MIDGRNGGVHRSCERSRFDGGRTLAGGCACLRVLGGIGCCWRSRRHGLLHRCRDLRDDCRRVRQCCARDRRIDRVIRFSIGTCGTSHRACDGCCSRRSLGNGSVCYCRFRVGGNRCRQRCVLRDVRLGSDARVSVLAWIRLGLSCGILRTARILLCSWLSGDGALRGGPCRVRRAGENKPERSADRRRLFQQRICDTRGAGLHGNSHVAICARSAPRFAVPSELAAIGSLLISKGL